MFQIKRLCTLLNSGVESQLEEQDQLISMEKSIVVVRYFSVYMMVSFGVFQLMNTYKYLTSENTTLIVLITVQWLYWTLMVSLILYA